MSFGEGFVNPRSADASSVIFLENLPHSVFSGVFLTSGSLPIVYLFTGASEIGCLSVGPWSSFAQQGIATLSMYTP